MSTTVTILTTEPVVSCIAEMALQDGIRDMVDWVRSRRPECVPEEYDEASLWSPLFPHSLTERVGVAERPLTGNELLVELAGRKCYDSFGLKAGKKTNREYIANTQTGDVPHRSIMYHAKMSFFIGGVSRRVSHELIRHYVGADRTEEGSPSQESTRYVEHAGFYIAHPAILESESELSRFGSAMQSNYDEYRTYISRRAHIHRVATGEEPKGMARKRIFESASPYLSHACETSWIWTANPISLAKMFHERDNDGADLEFRRLAKKWKRLALDRWPGLFPQPWMQEG
jgi:thymidylate synthase (FAD)